jgi:hypothetical protein
MTPTTGPRFPAPSGLIIAEPWISMILNGVKTWEMRTTPTRKRGRIALIRKGSGQVVGTANLVDSFGPLTRQQMLDSVDRHGVPADLIRSGSVDSWVYPWVLADVARIDPPVAYAHPPGAVIWLTLDSSSAESVGPATHPVVNPAAPSILMPPARLDTEASRLAQDAEHLLASRFQRTRKPTLKVAGFRASSGRELAIERSRQRVLVWAEIAPSQLQGMRIVNVRNPGQPYAAGQSRNSNLRTMAPKLSAAHRAVYLEFADIAALRQFVEWYKTA